MIAMPNWNRTVFLHTGWTSRYDGTEAPEGGHAYLKKSIGVEAENFKPVDGWCYGYAPVSRTSEGRSAPGIPNANRTLNIEKLGAASYDYELSGITVIWTARHPAKARTEDCHLVPVARRSFDVIQKRKGFRGMAAAWFPGLHADGPAKEMLDDLTAYLPTIRQYTHTGEKN